jgi:N-acyl-D-amino-acid deacylase
MIVKYDLVLRGALIMDGSGAPSFEADVGIAGGRIAAVTGLKDAKSFRLIDVSGLAVSPGFIDMHSHSDESLLVNPRAESKIRQGVTTEVLGNCGNSPAPLEGELLGEVRDELKKEYDLDVSWLSVGEYYGRLETQGTAVNCLTLVGNGNLRACALGFEDRRSTPEQMRKMKSLLFASMKDGAWGLSSGLIYVPSIFSDAGELSELAGVLPPFGGIYATHMRSEGDRLLMAIEEAAEVGRKAGVFVEISHLKSSGRRNWGQASRALNLLGEFLGRGVRLGWDQYPYSASSTGLDKVLPLWALEGGSDAALLRLRNHETYRKILNEVEGHPQKDWSRVIISTVPSRKYSSWEGLSVKDASAAAGKEPSNLVLDLLREEGMKVGAIFLSMCDEDVETIMKSPLTAIGSDAAARAPYGALGRGKPHPRSYGTFARVLGNYCRERKFFPIEEAVRRMTGLPASRLALEDRGLIREGYWADLVVFDPAGIRDTATYGNPHSYPEGIVHVLVNGKVTVEAGDHTGILAGKVLRKRAAV